MLNSWQAALSVVCLSLSSVPVAVSGSTLEGKVFGPDGQPIKGADISLQNSSARLEAVLTKTDVRGQYRFLNVASGTYKVSVSSSANVVQRLIADVKVDGNKRVDLKINPVNSAARTKEKRLVWVPPPTGTNIGGRWKEVDNTGAPVANVFKGDLNSTTVASTGVPRNGSASSVIGGTQGTFTATHIGTKPGPR
jgi:Carboxypeptidase regulatory-like domain